MWRRYSRRRRADAVGTSAVSARRGCWRVGRIDASPGFADHSHPMVPHATEQPRSRTAWSDYRPFLLYYFALYLSNAFFGPFLSRYLDSIGFSKSSIGFIIGWAPVAALLVQPAWGILGDRVRVKNRLLAALIASNAVIVALLPLHRSIVWVAALLVLVKVFQGPVSNMSSTIALEELKSRGREFGPVRMAGTIGYMAYFLALGPVLAHWGFPAAFGLSATMLCVSLLLSLTLPRVPGHREKRVRVSYRALYGDRELVLLVVFACLLMMMMYHYYNNFTIYLRYLTGSDTLGTLAVAVSTVGEIPFLLASGRIVKRFGVRKMLIAAGFMMGVRFLIWGFVTNPQILLVSQLLHATNFVVLDYSLAVYINDRMPPELKATGQAFKMVVGFTLPLAIGSPVVGILSDLLGIQAVFRIGSVWFFGVTMLFAVVLTAVGRRRVSLAE